MAVRDHTDCTDAACYRCKLLSVSVSPRAMPTRSECRRYVPPRKPNPAWERGIARDSRGMPYLKEDGSEMGVKEYGERRHEINERKRQLANTYPTKE